MRRLNLTRDPVRGLDVREMIRAAGAASEDVQSHSPLPAAEGRFCPTCGAKPIGSNARRCTTCLAVGCDREIRSYETRPALGRIVDITDAGIVDQAVPHFPADGEHPGPLAPTPQARVDAAMRSAADEIDAGLGAGGSLFTAMLWAAVLVVILNAIFSR